MFDRSFKRSYNVEFIFNTDMKEFRQKLKYGKNATKPILFIFWPEVFMSMYSNEYNNVLRNYSDVFDVYYCRNEKEAAKFFKLGPKELPHIFIIDPQ